MKKLVRDRIPEIIRRNGKIPEIKFLQSEDVQEALLEKLEEEHEELRKQLNAEEIVDMIEVLLSLASNIGFDEKTTLQLLYEKRSKRGGFNQGIILIGVNDSFE